MADSNHYDCIVVGLGGIGSATLYWLTKKTNKRKLNQLNKSHNFLQGLAVLHLGAMSDSNHYDCIVVGLGGIGSATPYWLTKKTNKRKLNRRIYLALLNLTPNIFMVTW